MSDTQDELDRKLREATALVRELRARRDAALPQPLAAVLGAEHERETGCRCGKPFTQWRFMGQWMPDACPVCLAGEGRDAPVELSQRERDARVAALLRDMQLPRRYQDADLDRMLILGDAANRATLLEKQRLARGFVTRWPGRFTNDRFPVTVAMVSETPGTGKTYAAAAIGRAVVQRHLARVVFAPLRRVLLDVRAAWGGREGPSEDARLRRYLDADLLILDEVSRHALRGDVSSDLYDLVGPRDAEQRPTILTTNEAPAEFEDWVGPALVSRLSAGGFWHFGNVDLRQHGEHDA